LDLAARTVLREKQTKVKHLKLRYGYTKHRQISKEKVDFNNNDNDDYNDDDDDNNNNNNKGNNDSV
jgi:hypothetical protein